MPDLYIYRDLQTQKLNSLALPQACTFSAKNIIGTRQTFWMLIQFSGCVRFSNPWVPKEFFFKSERWIWPSNKKYCKILFILPISNLFTKQSVQSLWVQDHFTYSIDKIIIQTSCFIVFCYLSVQNPDPLSKIPWVPWNPWNFGEGFRNPWILNRFISKCNQTRRLKHIFSKI